MRATDRVAPRRSPVSSVRALVRVARPNEPRREKRQGTLKTPPALGAPFAACTRGIGRVSNLKRLSATDILALASMKNAAKCDTWCELQNPVNHRVFERKLRPKPLCRGHVCLGVTHIVALRLGP